MDRGFADFVKSFDVMETPVTSLLRRGKGWTVPEFCAKTKKQTVDPFYEWYSELCQIVEGVTPERDEEDWGTYDPSEWSNRLRKLANRIGQLAYQEVDNPAYDEAQCLAWKEENAKSWTKIEWGVGSVIPVASETQDEDEGVRLPGASSVYTSGGDQSPADTED